MRKHHNSLYASEFKCIPNVLQEQKNKMSFTAQLFMPFDFTIEVVNSNKKDYRCLTSEIKLPWAAKKLIMAPSTDFGCHLVIQRFFYFFFF